MERQLRVLIADDQALMRTGFRMIVESEPDMTVVAEAHDGVSAVSLAQEHRPDVVLMDIRMPKMDGIAATRQLAGPDAPTPTAVLVLTTFDLDEYVYAALRAGASGFLLKDEPVDQLIHALRVVAEGDALLAPAVTRRLIQEFTRRPDPSHAPGALAVLTRRELEVLTLMAKGLSNAEIAQELVLGQTTVKTHVSRVLLKLNLRDRVQAVVLAYEQGLVRANS
ncbi:MAG: response regulator transcription factor [Corynebacteriales bacterium]|nr:response regulator transcription factor [Mycobacteriales bacterium]